MFIDALDLNSDTYLHVNVKLISVLGLNAAVYCSEVLTLIRRYLDDKTKCITDETSGNLYVKINRTYITERTGISSKEQAQIDNVLESKGLLLKHPSVNSAIILDVKQLLKIVTGEETIPFEGTVGLDNSVPMVEAYKQPSDKSKRTAIARELKKCIPLDGRLSVKMREALKEWIDSIVKKSNKRLSKAEVEAFIEGIQKYADADLALAVVKTAIRYQFKMLPDAEAKLVYNEEVSKEVKRIKQVANNEVKRTGPNLATLEDVEGGDEF